MKIRYHPSSISNERVETIALPALPIPRLDHMLWLLIGLQALISLNFVNRR